MMRNSVPASFYVFYCCVLVYLCTCSPIDDDSEYPNRHKRSAPTLNDRTRCDPGEWPGTRVNTTQRLADLRSAMRNLNVDAFLILAGDAHGSEYPAERDKRRGFISGFTGSAGYAAVTMTKAALWTDARYFQEAEDALDCNWIFMKRGEPGVPGATQWLRDELTTGQVVGADPFFVTNTEWRSMEDWLQKAGVNLTAVASNPVDTVWTDQPPPPETTINALDIKYAGRSWQDKITDVHSAMEEREIHGGYVLTNLDEIAWLFNLRASDIEYNPFFISYAVVEYYGQSNVQNKVRLYVHDKNRRLTANPTDPETTVKLYEHLNTNHNGSCAGKTGLCVQVHEYIPSQVVTDIAALAAASSDNKVWINTWCNQAIFNAIPQAQRSLERSYITYAKTQKNPTETQGMKTCNNRDAAVLIEFLAKLEKDVTEVKGNWTEVTAAAELKRMRLAADKNRGLSFASIAGSGPNAAVIHYRPGPDTDRRLTTSDMFLLDSGGQYLDCTTDTTRTMYYGTPTDYMIESYTRVLMGSIDLARAVWPQGQNGVTLEILARHPLWAAGLDYKHGTGHGVGAYLSVHDGPVYIGGASRASSPEILLPYMFLSDEPGFYEPGEFGIRLETVLMVEPITTKHDFRGIQHLHFKPIALVPFEPKLIDYTLMSNHQIEWLNTYHKLTQDTMEPLLTTDLAKNWLRQRTKPYPIPTFTPCNPTSSTSHPAATSLLPLMLVAAALTLLF